MNINELSKSMTAAELDNHAVDQLANLMKQKLAKKREQGYNGWPNCDPNHLSRLLRDHVEKGDPVDVANFCAFLVANGDFILPVKNISKAENYYEGFELECPTCYLSLFFQPLLKPDGTADCYLGKRSCIRCNALMTIDYRKDINRVVANLIRDEADEH